MNAHDHTKSAYIPPSLRGKSTTHQTQQAQKTHKAQQQSPQSQSWSIAKKTELKKRANPSATQAEAFDIPTSALFKRLLRREATLRWMIPRFAALSNAEANFSNSTFAPAASPEATTLLSFF